MPTYVPIHDKSHENCIYQFRSVESGWESDFTLAEAATLEWTPVDCQIYAMMRLYEDGRLSGDTPIRVGMAAQRLLAEYGDRVGCYIVADDTIRETCVKEGILENMWLYDEKDGTYSCMTKYGLVRAPLDVWHANITDRLKGYSYPSYLAVSPDMAPVSPEAGGFVVLSLALRRWFDGGDFSPDKFVLLRGEVLLG